MNIALALMRAPAWLLSPPGSRARLLVLSFHRVTKSPDPLLAGEVDSDQFKMQINALQSAFNVLPLSKAWHDLQAGTLPARSACLTFDDGYATNAELALPVLQEAGLQGTFFVATGFLNGGRMFNDTVIEVVRRLPVDTDLSDLGLGQHHLENLQQRSALIDRLLKHVKYMEPDKRLHWVDQLADRVDSLPTDLMMTDAQVRSLSEAGMEIGGHTISHPILTRVDDAVARREIAGGRSRLQEITGTSVDSFAYPNGVPGRDYGPEHLEMVASAGFRQAVSTAWGAATRRTDPMQIPRVGSWDRNSLKFTARMLKAYLDPQADTVEASGSGNASASSLDN